MSSAEEVGIAFAARPTAQARKNADLLKARVRGLVSGMMAGLIMALMGSCTMLCLFFWFGPSLPSGAIALLLEEIAGHAGPMCFALGFLSAIALRVYYLMARWLIRLPWREMLG
jgi:hypothetical protein